MSLGAGAYDYRESHVNERRGAYYDNLYREGSALGFYWRHFERPFLERTFEALKARHPHGRYLDFACGTGRILQVGSTYFPDAMGIDVSEAMLEVARDKVPDARIVRADVLREKADVGRFEVITLFRFLVRAGALREPILRYLRSVIAEDGTLIVNNHRNARSLRGLTYRVSTKVRPTPFEGDLLRDDEVRDLLDRTGFTVEETYGFGVVPSFRGRLLMPPGMLLRLERRASKSERMSGWTKNRIYVCRPKAES